MCNLFIINYLVSKANKFHQNNSLNREDDLNQALFYVNRALSIEKFPSNELLCETYFLRGKIYLGLKNHIESILDLDKTIKIEKDHYLAFYYRGKAKKELFLFDEALKDFDNAIKLKSNERDFFIERAFLKVELKLFSDALDDFDNAIDIDHNSSFIFFQKGIYEAQLRNFGEAVKNFDIALKKPLENNFQRNIIEIHKKYAEEKYVENFQNLFNKNKLFKEYKKY